MIIDAAKIQAAIGDDDNFAKYETSIADSHQKTVADVRDYLTGKMGFTEESGDGAAVIFRLAGCPFKGKQVSDDRAYIIVDPQNGIIARCHADKCDGMGWPEMQEAFGEPFREVKAAKSKATKDKAPSASKLLINYAKDGELFHTPGGEAFATVPVADHRETYRVRSSAFKLWLNHRFYQRTGGAPTSKVISEALGVIESIALFEGGQHEVNCRLGRRGDTLYLDLCNDKWEVVEIDASGYRVVPCPAEMKFRRARGQLTLPYPAPDAKPEDMDELRRFVNVSDASWPLLVGGLVSSLRLPGPYFILLFRSEHGAAKTTTMKLCRGVIDPNEAAVRTNPKDDHSLLLAALNGLFVSVDNASNLPEWLLDGLCRMATGGGFGTRAHYEQNEEYIASAMRPTMLSTIVDLTRREDFLSRCLVIDCPAITKQTRKDEQTLLADFESVKPRILGALLHGVSTAIRNLPNTRPEELPRMADAFRFCLAAEPAFSWEPGTFAKRFADCESDIDNAILEHPVAVALMALMAGKQEWCGTTHELLDELSKYANATLWNDKLWPTNATAMGKALQRLQATLPTCGIIATHKRRTWRLTKGKA
jgi:hypothetical protein